MKNQDFINLVAQLDGAKYIDGMGHDSIKDHVGLLNFLSTQPAPYYNYVLCVFGDDRDIRPFYAGYTADLTRRVTTHTAKVDYDWIYIYHSPSKDVALANEQTLMDILGTRDLMNGQLTQMTSVSREQIMDVIDGLDIPMDKVRRYACADDIRKTYYLNHVLHDALRTYAFDHRMDISETVRRCLVTGIPEEYLEAAYQQRYGRKVAQ